MNDCKHEHLKCTDNVYYCIDCGERVVPQENPVKEEAPKKPTRRKKGE